MGEPHGLDGSGRTAQRENDDQVLGDRRFDGTDLALAAEGPLDLVLALGSALSWAAGTVYVRWARLKGDATTTRGSSSCASSSRRHALRSSKVIRTFISLPAILSLAFHGLVGTAAAYLLWFDIVNRLPAAIASLGVLSVPAISAPARSAAGSGRRRRTPSASR